MATEELTYTRCGDSIFILDAWGNYAEIVEFPNMYSIKNYGLEYDLTKLLGGRRGILDGILDLERDRNDHHRGSEAREARYKGATTPSSYS